jgi:hypothetical protein
MKNWLKRLMLGLVLALVAFSVCGLTYAFIPDYDFTFLKVSHSDYPGSDLLLDNSGASSSELYIDMASMVSAPTNFTATVVGTDIYLSWIESAGSLGTLIRRGETIYPDSTDEGTLVYLGIGNSFVDTGADADIKERHYSAWAYDAVNYSNTYATVKEGGYMMNLIINIAFLALIVLIAYWKKHPLLYIIAGLGLALFGFQWMLDARWLYIGILAVVMGAATLLMPLLKRRN